MADPMKTFCDEARGFHDRNRDELDRTGEFPKVAGMVTWGLMRALAECPGCPGIFRTPIGSAFGCASAFDVLRCPNCTKVWATTDGHAALTAATESAA